MLWIKTGSEIIILNLSFFMSKNEGMPLLSMQTPMPGSCPLSAVCRRNSKQVSLLLVQKRYWILVLT